MLIIGGINLYRAFALYKVEQSFNVLNGVVPNFNATQNGDVKTIALINGEIAKTFPSKNDGYVIEEITCDHDATGTWDNENWGILISNLTQSGTTCTINFNSVFKDLKESINSNANNIHELLANSDDVDKMVASKEAMEIIEHSELLRKFIKESANYTTAVKKKILNSTVISEERKYAVELPCYLYKNGTISSMIGGFSAANSGKWPSTGNQGSYYRIGFWGGPYQAGIISTKAVNLKNYDYLELYFNILADGTDAYVMFQAVVSSDFNGDEASYPNSYASGTNKNVTISHKIGTNVAQGTGKKNTSYYIRTRLHTVSSNNGQVNMNLYTIALY